MVRIIETITSLCALASVAAAVAIRAPGAMPASCSGGGAAKYSMSTAPGWKAVKVAGGLSQPRGMVWDSAGHLLVVQTGKGITSHTVGDDGCITGTKTVVSQAALNHGITLSPDGKTLYASSMTTVWQWAYDASSQSVSGTAKVIISGMFSGGSHVSRTLAIAKSHPNLLVVNHGSNANFDTAAASSSTGRAIVKVFDLTKVPDAGSYNYAKDGSIIGYGLRNEIALIFDGNDMLWGAENSGDDFVRGGKDIHTDNPAEKLNYLGDITKPQTTWYGYPTCFAVWQPSAITDKKYPTGGVFNYNGDDTACAKSQAPRLSFQAHSAPIDGAFDEGYKNLYMTFHGSWDRSPGTGYKLVQIPFKNGTNGYEPVAAADSMTGYTDIWYSSSITGSCGYSNGCMRPAGVVMDKAGRLYVSSDAGEGEIYLIGKA